MLGPRLRGLRGGPRLPGELPREQYNPGSPYSVGPQPDVSHMFALLSLSVRSHQATQQTKVRTQTPPHQ